MSAGHLAGLVQDSLYMHTYWSIPSDMSIQFYQSSVEIEGEWHGTFYNNEWMNEYILALRIHKEQKRKAKHIKYEKTR